MPVVPPRRFGQLSRVRVCVPVTMRESQHKVSEATLLHTGFLTVLPMDRLHHHCHIVNARRNSHRMGDRAEP